MFHSYYYGSLSRYWVERNGGRHDGGISIIQQLHHSEPWIPILHTSSLHPRGPTAGFSSTAQPALQTHWCCGEDRTGISEDCGESPEWRDSFCVTMTNCIKLPIHPLDLVLSTINPNLTNGRSNGWHSMEDLLCWFPQCEWMRASVKKYNCKYEMLVSGKRCSNDFKNT